MVPLSTENRSAPATPSPPDGWQLTPAAAFPAAAVMRELRAMEHRAAAPALEHPMWRRARPWLLIFAAWTVFGIFTANQSYLFYAVTFSREIPWRDLYAVSLASVWMWALFTPLLVWLARRFRVERNRKRNIAAHIAAAFGIAIIDVALDLLVQPLISSVDRGDYLSRFLYQIDLNLISYSVVVGFTHASDYYNLYRERRLRAAELANQLTLAQLQMLRMQLQPHFLFNTLHAIAELVHEDPDTADRMIGRLGDLLRLSLETTGEQEVPLRRELELLGAYLEIEQTRFRDRLTIDMRIAPATLDARVPNLLLQPLVENAIRHGTGSRASAGRVEISTNIKEERLWIEIRDDGVGIDPTIPAREGVGLRNTRERMQQLYGDEQTFALENARGGGAVARLSLPYRLAPMTAPTHLDQPQRA